MAALPVIDSTIKLIDRGIAYLTLLLKTSTVRRMRRAIDAGEQYILVNERNGEYENFSDEKQTKYLKHYRRLFFKYNN